jgi:tetratricopeptide (TPR) repeat protein
MLDTAIRLMPSHPSPYLRLGDAHFHLGEFEQSIAAARKGYELGPDSARAMIVVAMSARALGRPEVAIEAYRKGLVNHPGAWELHTGLADVLLETGDVEAARREAEEGVRLSSGNPVAVSVRDRVLQPRPDSVTAEPDSGRVQ